MESTDTLQHLLEYIPSYCYLSELKYQVPSGTRTEAIVPGCLGPGVCYILVIGRRLQIDDAVGAH